MMERIYSVTQINTYVKNMFTYDPVLQAVSVKGEVSNCTYHRSNHIYFTLKDGKSTISCVMFAGNRRGLNFEMKEGMQVVVKGNIDVFERDGKYQLYARTITREGIGELYEQFEALKKDLEERGMFDPCYKQPIPKYIKTLGVVTAPTGAAIQDIRNISLRHQKKSLRTDYSVSCSGTGGERLEEYCKRHSGIGKIACRRDDCWPRRRFFGRLVGF